MGGIAADTYILGEFKIVNNFSYLLSIWKTGNNSKKRNRNKNIDFIILSSLKNVNLYL